MSHAHELTKDLPGERWQDYPGHALLEVSTEGRVRVKERVDGRGHKLRKQDLRSATHQDEYVLVRLVVHGKHTRFFPHRLVLETFVGPAPAGCEGCHRDGNPKNNRLVNLYWGTPRDNTHDSIRHGTFARGERSGKAKLTESAVRVIRNCRGKVQQTVLARRYGVTAETVRQAQVGLTWRHV